MMTIIFEQFQRWIPNEGGRRSTEVKDNLQRALQSDHVTV